MQVNWQTPSRRSGHGVSFVENGYPCRESMLRIRLVGAVLVVPGRTLGNTAMADTHTTDLPA